MDSSALDRALVGRLMGDATLMALMPDGVFFDVGGHGATAFVIVGLLSDHDDPMFGGRAYEDPEYVVKAVHLATSADVADEAAARIDALVAIPVTADGYTCTALERVERIAYTEVDDLDPSIRYQHRGGRYALAAAPSAEAPGPPPWVQGGWIQP